MDKKLIELISKYNIENKKVDQQFYVEFFNIARSTLGLEEYLKELVFIGAEEHMSPKYKSYTDGFEGLFGQAAYKRSTGELIVFERNIEYGKRMVIKENKIESFYEVQFYNLLILQTLLHEIEHAKQEKMRDEGNDVESKLLQVFDNGVKETSLSYEYSLNERLAEVRSFEQILDAYAEFNIYDQKLYDFFLDGYRQSCLRGYHHEDENGYLVNGNEGIFMSPTIKYAILKEVDLSVINEITVGVEGDDRFVYGLPVQYEEYKEYAEGIKGYKI